MQTGVYLNWRRAAALFALLALELQPVHAVVTWTTIECGGATVGGQSLDNIWDNAALMAANAESSITTLNAATKIIPLTPTANLANNAKWMFGISFDWLKGLDQTNQDVLTKQVYPVFDGAKGLLQLNKGFLICGGETAIVGTVGSFANVWHYSIPGTENVLVLSGQNAAERPCSDTASPIVLGQTFNGYIYPATGDQSNPEKAIGILFCTKLLDSNNYKGTLASGFSASGSSPDPDQYRSAAGTLLHEMIHATNTDVYQDQRNAVFGDTNAAYGFARCGALSKADQAQALVNPDGFRIFAEMCMSPNTRWGSPKPPNASNPPPSKRSLTRPDGPRLSAAERRAAGALFGPAMSVPGGMQMDYAGELGWAS